MSTWNVYVSFGKETGNSLIGNLDISLLRRAHRVHLANYSIVSVKAMQITGDIVYDYTQAFWYKVSDIDVLLYEIPVLGFNLGLRYDEISNLKVEHALFVSGSITLTILESIKTQLLNASIEFSNGLRTQSYGNTYSWILFSTSFMANKT